MEQPLTPNSSPQAPNQPREKPTTQRQKLPTPQELITLYTEQGIESQEASIKVIEDLQNVLYKLISSNNIKSKQDKFMAETSRKMDAFNNRLAVVDMKVDSKPGYGETFAIGVASGAASSGIASVLPHVFENGFSCYWFLRYYCCLYDCKWYTPLCHGICFDGPGFPRFTEVGWWNIHKSSRCGSRLVGKVEQGIPEDDPQNPAVTADLDGFDVGDCAARGVNLFKSILVEIICSLKIEEFNMQCLQ
ncbi:H_PPase domain-containing protein [Cephalotus follicularis]|uniref:H(+)-exporting diphosphatase n=1 Tax=Cephalotus follicularis TaxID=3775 RepID=A0A1Q3C0D9_CEPFO|nr:H_PPase domain-containing protein [Cephalotus follicularis]